VLTERKLPSRRGLLLPYKQSGDSGDRDAYPSQRRTISRALPRVGGMLIRLELDV